MAQLVATESIKNEVSYISNVLSCSKRMTLLAGTKVTQDLVVELDFTIKFIVYSDFKL